MYNVRKKDLLYGYMASFFVYSSNIIILPFILRNLTPSEYAIWFIFLALSAFVILFDLGYGNVIRRYIMYANSGAKKINSDTIPQTQKNHNPNYKLLYQVMIASSKIYSKISKISIVVLALLTPYIFYISNSEYNVIQIAFPWIIFSLSVVNNIYISSDATIIKGLGLIGQLHKIMLINSVFSTLIKMISLEMGFGILGLSISFFITSILLTYQYKKITNFEKNKDINLYKSAMKSFDKDFVDTFKIIKDKSKGIGGVLISNFLQNQLFTIVAPIFISLEIMGRYGLTWQVISVIASLSSIAFATYTTQMGNYLVLNKTKELKETFSITLSVFIVFYFMGSLITFYFGKFLLEFIGSKIEILPDFQIFLIIIFIFLIQITQKATNILSLSNNQSYVKSLIVSTILIAILNLVILYLGFGIVGVLINNIIIYSSYILWKWTIESFKLCNVKFVDLIIVPYQKLKRIILKT